MLSKFTSAKDKLHQLLLKRGLSLPEYSRTTQHDANVTIHTTVATLTLKSGKYQATGTGSKYSESDDIAASLLLAQVETSVARIPRIPRTIQLKKGHGTWQEQYQEGEYAGALKRYCRNNQLEDPVVDDKTQKERLFTGGNAPGRMGSIGKKKHVIVVKVGELQRSCTHPKVGVALQLASKAVLDELQKRQQKEHEP